MLMAVLVSWAATSRMQAAFARQHCMLFLGREHLRWFEQVAGSAQRQLELCHEAAAAASAAEASAGTAGIDMHGQCSC